MRGAQLIGCHVVDCEGTAIGTVHDLRLVAGPTAHGLAGYRLDALITGRAAGGDRLGYTTGDVSGPWPLPAVFGWLSGGVYVVPWRSVAALEGRVIRLSSRRADLPTFQDVAGGAEQARDDVAGPST
jgi:sporulation protein YlmC with PRC-barrel domain